MISRYGNHRHWFGAAVLIAVGTIGLIANFDLVPRVYLEQLWKLWPLILIVLGLSILLRRRDFDRGTGP